MKVRAGLTWTSAAPEGDEPDADPVVKHQIERYLAVARQAPPGSAYVVALSPSLLDVGDAAGDLLYLGWVRWQEVYDDARSMAGATPSSHVGASSLIGQFLELLEERGMAAPGFTFESITSIFGYLKFRTTLDAILTHAKDSLVEEGALSDFQKVTGKNCKKSTRG